MTFMPDETKVDYKGYTIFREPSYNLWSVKQIDETAPLPAALLSRFTEIQIAKDTIDRLDRK